MKVEIYSDVACPWCYIGERRFARALSAFPGAADVEIVFRPYQLDPTAPDDPVPMAQYLTKRFGRPMDGMFGRVTEAAAADGITMDLDGAIAVNTRTAHRLSRLALHEYGAAVQRRLMDRLFDAYFTNGADVSDHALLTELAESAGMNRERVQQYLASDEGTAELEAEFEAARARGINAVPTFVFEEQFAVEGAQPASTFLQVLEEVQRRVAKGALSTNGTLDGSADRIDDTGGADCADGICAVADEAR